MEKASQIILNQKRKETIRRTSSTQNSVLVTRDYQEKSRDLYDKNLAWVFKELLHMQSQTRTT